MAAAASASAVNLTMATEASACCVSQPIATAHADRLRKMPLASAYGWLALWSIVWTWQRWRAPEAALGDAWSLMGGLLGFGFACNLVLGIGPRLVAKMAGRPLPPLWTSVVASLGFGAAALVALVDALPVTRFGWIGIVQVSALGLAATGLVTGVVLQLRGSANADRCPGARLARPGDKWASLLTAAVPAYAALAALLALRNGFLDPAALHLWMLGVVAIAIYAVLHRFVPRFSKTDLPDWLHGAQALAAVAAPAFVAWAIAGGAAVAVALAAALALVSVVSCTGLVLLALRGRRSRGPVLAGLAVACAFALMGTALGVWFLQGDRRLLDVHAGLNLLGFVGVAALSMGAVFLGVGIRAVERGAMTPMKGALALSAVSLAAWAGVGLVVGHPVPLFDMFLGGATLLHAFLGLQAVAK